MFKGDVTNKTDGNYLKMIIQQLQNELLCADHNISIHVYFKPISTFNNFGKPNKKHKLLQLLDCICFNLSNKNRVPWLLVALAGWQKVFCIFIFRDFFT